MERFLILSLLLFFFLNITTSSAETTDNFVYVKLNGTAEIPLPAVANYRRTVQNAESVSEEHIYRVCNAKNKAKCGFWENVKTKKKVVSGATSYNKNKKVLIVKNVLLTDFGVYMTGNKKKSCDLNRLIVKG